MNKLPEEVFGEIVKSTPLVSIDLIIENPDNEILLGWRSNPPAKDCWFVPGGRILKDEKYADAFQRIVMSETGLSYTLQDSAFLGVYEHIYSGDNYCNDPSYGTHYIVLAYRIRLDEALQNLPDEQHENYWWAGIDNLLENKNVHENTRNYFNGHPSFAEYAWKKSS